MPLTVVGLPEKRGFGETARRDAWWALPGVVFVLLVSFDHCRACHGLHFRSSPDSRSQPRVIVRCMRPGWRPDRPDRKVRRGPGLSEGRASRRRGVLGHLCAACCSIGTPAARIPPSAGMRA